MTTRAEVPRRRVGPALAYALTWNAVMWLGALACLALAGGRAATAWLGFTLGAAAGCWLNLAGYRLLRGESISGEPAHCPACKAALRQWHQLPLLGYALLRGRCAVCRAPIPKRYPAAELACGAALAALALMIVW